jgi:hypothetical protein
MFEGFFQLPSVADSDEKMEAATVVMEGGCGHKVLEMADQA